MSTTELRQPERLTSRETLATARRIVVKIGSRMVDASLRTKLNSIRLAMREAR